MIWLVASGALLEREEKIGIAPVCEEGKRENSTEVVVGIMSCKGGWEKSKGLGSESRISSGVSTSDLINLDMALKTV